MLSDSSTSGAGAAANADTKMLYAGEQYDSSASMYYNRSRWYNPATGTFNRMDPFAGNNRDPQSLHKYLYTHCNPINGIDPSGKSLITNVTVTMAITAILFSANIANAPRPGDTTCEDASALSHII